MDEHISVGRGDVCPPSFDTADKRCKYEMHVI